MSRSPSGAYPSLRELCRIIGAAKPAGDAAIEGISTDTRSIAPGELFVALGGERYDGHDHVARALDVGAAFALVEHGWSAAGVGERQLLRVDSPLAAYQALAAWRRRRFGGQVVAVTGSVGKTTTKELIVAALSTAGRVLSTPGNHNNEIGVPRTLLDLDDSRSFAVIEMGMRGLGQIRELAEIALPGVAVITNVGSAHIGLLGSRQRIAQAKCELLECLAPEGVAILNADCSDLMERAAKVWHGDTLTFGLDAGDVRGELVDDTHMRARLRGGAWHSFQLPVVGAHNALNFLAALAVSQQLGVPWEQLRQLSVALPAGRAQRLALAGDIVLLDETYNAGPESMSAALRVLVKEPCRRHIAVLGTMKELGDHSAELHRQVGEQVAALGVHALLILADDVEAEALLEGARSVDATRFSDADALLGGLRRMLTAGDCVLFKASRSVALDRVVAALVEERGEERGRT